MSKKKPITKPLSSSVVQEYLRNNLDFFATNNKDIQQLLYDIKVPHESGANTISLLEYQNKLWRKKAMQAEEQQRLLFSDINYNRDVMSIIHKAALQVINAADLQSLCRELEEIFIKDFKITSYSLVFFISLPESKQYTYKSRNTVPREVLRILDDKKLFSGALPPIMREFFFGAQGKKLSSFLCAPLYNSRAPFAVLCLASEEETRFSRELLTDYVGFLVEAIRATMIRHIKDLRGGSLSATKEVKVIKMTKKSSSSKTKALKANPPKAKTTKKPKLSPK